MHILEKEIVGLGESLNALGSRERKLDPSVTRRSECGFGAGERKGCIWMGIGVRLGGTRWEERKLNVENGRVNGGKMIPQNAKSLLLNLTAIHLLHPKS